MVICGLYYILWRKLKFSKAESNYCSKSFVQNVVYLNNFVGFKYMYAEKSTGITANYVFKNKVNCLFVESFVVYCPRKLLLDIINVYMF